MLSSYGWNYLVPLNDAESIKVVSDDKDQVEYLRSVYGSKIYTSGYKEKSFLVLNLHEKSSLPELDTSKFSKIFVLTKNPLFLDFFKPFMMKILKKVQVESKSDSESRFSYSDYKKTYDFSNFKFESGFYFFLNEKLCTHIINSKDKVGVKLFYEEIGQVKAARMLTKLPLFVKKLGLIFLSEQKLIVVKNGQ